MAKGSNAVRIIITIWLLAMWTALILLPLVGQDIEAPPYVFIGLTALVFLVVGKVWDLEVERLLAMLPGLETNRRRAEDRDDGDD